MREELPNMEEVRKRHKGQHVRYERHHWYDWFYVVTVFDRKTRREVASYVIQSFTLLSRLK
jgi:hypothetical protein